MFRYLRRRLLERTYRPRHMLDTDLCRPNVIFDFVFDRGLFFMSVQNIGETPAVKVSVEFAQRITGVDGKQNIADLPLFQNIEFLAPHKEISTFLDRSDSYFERGEPTEISVNVKFADMQGDRYNNHIRHNLEIYKDVCYIRRSKPMVFKSSTSCSRQHGNPIQRR